MGKMWQGSKFSERFFFAADTHLLPKLNKKQVFTTSKNKVVKLIHYWYSLELMQFLPVAGKYRLELQGIPVVQMNILRDTV